MTGKVSAAEPPRRQGAARERWELLRQLDALLDAPMAVLSFVWLGLLVLELTVGLSRPLELLGYGIWALFGLQFAVGLAIAPRKLAYLRANWLTVVALVLPAFRLLRVLWSFRLLRAARATRSLSLVRLLTSTNRGVGAVGATLGRRGVGYAAALTGLITLAGAAGMAQLESPAALREAGQTGAGLDGYGEALWWTAMLMTTMGSEYWPQTLEGRLLGWLLAVYAFAVFGYLTATIASLFISQDARTERAPAAPGSGADLEGAALRAQLAALSAQVAELSHRLAGQQPRAVNGDRLSEGRASPVTETSGPPTAATWPRVHRDGVDDGSAARTARGPLAHAEPPPRPPGLDPGT